jgi:hypothetical protein
MSSYAPIAEESNGMLLSVLSALARLNVDPWDEASRLARSPRGAATLFLTILIAALPGGASAPGDPEMHARRLTALPPRGGHNTNNGVGSFVYWLVDSGHENCGALELART